MNTIYRAGWVLAVLLCTAGTISAQKSSVNEELVKADRQFALYAYNLAMQTYQGVLKDDPNNAHALARIGDCYYQLDNPDKSLEWYQRAIRQSNVESDVHLRYGKALMQTADYEDARDQFRAYSEADQTVGDHYAQMCDYAIDNSKKESAWQVRNEALNTEFADYSPAFLGSRVVYNSARTDLAPKSKSGDTPSGSLNYLLVTQRNPESGFLQKPQILRSELQNTRNEGPVSFSADGRRVAFCRNNFINGTRQIAETGINMSLYTADVDENGKWSNIKAFPYNGSDFATGFPALSPDGNTLIFASTQPGGFGGWDIYVTNFRDGAWTTPRNLGSPLNTPGNEVTPFFDGESLYFSSDWHFGLGGLDVYRAELGPERVSNVYHLGPGINSSRDDYGFIYDKNSNTGYVTSNRSGGRGAEDIWKLNKKWNDDVTAVGQEGITGAKGTTPNTYDTDNTQKTQGLHLLITDERGNEISGAEVDLTDCYGDKGFTAADGTFEFVELNNTIDCQAVIRKQGFRDASIVLRKFGKQNVRISLTPESRESYTGKVYDADSKAPLRGVTVQVQFEDGSKNVETLTDNNGSYSLDLDPGSTYMVNYGKYGYIDQISKTYFAPGMNNVPSIMMEKKVVEQPAYVDQNGKSLKPLMHDTEEAKSVTVLKKKQAVEETKVVEQPKFSGYAIQLAATPETPGPKMLNNYESLTKDGNLYVKSENNLNKIRLGVFKTRPEAEAALKNIVANRANKDAFIVPEYGADNDLVIGGVPSAPKPVELSTENTGLAVKGLNRPAVVYALQLATYTADKTIPVSDYNGLRGLGNLYSNTNNGYTQVRLGIWQSHDEALKARQEAIDRGFPSATIVTEEGNDSDIQDFIMESSLEQKKNKIAGTTAAPKPQVYSTETPVSNPATPYYIKIAALSNPDNFNGGSLADLGMIEKRPAEHAPGLTVILLGAYSSYEESDAVLKKVKARGFEDAYIMKDEKGKLIRK